MAVHHDDNAVPVSSDIDAFPRELLHCECFGNFPDDVCFKETHASWVFLTNRFAFKLKKPVKFDFLDFSTLALREHACHQELVLNRRLAGNVYIGVVPIVRNRLGQLRVDADGQVIEWAVKMRRLPDECSLESLIERQQVQQRDIKRLAERLTDFYRQLPPITICTKQYRQRIESHVRANHYDLLNPFHDLDINDAKRAYAAQLRTLAQHPNWFDDRAADGRLVDGHGDLRPDHIYLTPDPTVIDCIEFNAEYRQIDVLDELSFLAVECDLLDCPAVGEQVIAYYEARSGDQPSFDIVSFYKCYRACVRAKVAVIRSDQMDRDQRATYLQRARRYLRLAAEYGNRLNRPLMLVVRGLMGSGKTTLATELAKELGMEHLQTDVIRREQFGPAKQRIGYAQQRYQTENRNTVYETMFRQCSDRLDDGLSVILDGTFSTRQRVERAAAIAEDAGVAFRVIDCECPDNVAVMRIANRLSSGKTASDAQPEYYRLQQREFAALPGGMPRIGVDTTSPFPVMVAKVIDELPGA